MKPNFESSLSEENKRDRKNGLYRFKDDIEGDKDLKNLNMLYKKDGIFILFNFNLIYFF